MHFQSVKPYLVHAVLVAVVLAPFFPGVFLRGEVLVPMSHMYEKAPWSAHRPADLADQNPLGSEVTAAVCVWYKLANDAFDRGEWPLWNPYQFMGVPLIGNFQSAVFYPPRLIFRAMDDPYAAMTFYILVRFWLCGFNAFVAARMLGLRSPYANLFSFLFMLAGYNQLWTFYPPPDVMAWLPLLLAGAELLLNMRYRAGAAILTIAMTMSILAGHPSTVMLGCIGLALYALFRLAASRGLWRHTFACALCAAGAFALALAVSAIQVLPFIEYLPETEYFIDRFFPEGAAHYTYSGYDLLGLFGSRMVGTQHDGNFWGVTNHTYTGMLYVGITTWVLLSLIASRIPLDFTARSRVVSYMAASAICLYLASDMPLTEFVRRLPIISGTRPAYFFAFPTAALPLVAALSLQSWVNGGAPVHSLVRPALFTGAGALLIGVVILTAPYLSDGYIEQIDKDVELGPFVTTRWAIAVAIGGGVLLALVQCGRSAGRAHYCVWALCALCVLDQSIAMWGVMASTPRRYVVPETQVTDLLLSQEQPCRVRYNPEEIRSGYFTLYGIEELGGYDAVYPKRFKPYYDSLNTAPGAPVDALLSCGAAVFRDSAPIPDSYEPIVTTEGVTVARYTQTLPRARLVGSMRHFATPEEMFKAMNEPDFDPEHVVYTDTPTGVTMSAQGESPPGNASIVEWKSQYVRVDANANSECILVLADGYAPGWEATVDGKPAEVFPAYHIYRGVHLSPGDHTVDFRYRPAGFRAGQIVSYVGLAVSGTFAAAVLSYQRKRRGQRVMGQS